MTHIWVACFHLSGMCILQTRVKIANLVVLRELTELQGSNLVKMPNFTKLFEIWPKNVILTILPLDQSANYKYCIFVSPEPEELLTWNDRKVLLESLFCKIHVSHVTNLIFCKSTSLNDCSNWWKFQVDLTTRTHNRPVCKIPTRQVAELKFCTEFYIINTNHW